MSYESFKNLDLIPLLLDKMKLLEDRMSRIAPPITTKNEVAKFLNVTPRTINNYIEKGLLVESHHFYKKNGKILVFIEEAILNFRDELHKGLICEKTKI